jgi:hypothetical protein
MFEVSFMGVMGKWQTQQFITAIVDSDRNRLDVYLATTGKNVKVSS